MDGSLSTISDVLIRADDRLRTPLTSTTIWPTGFDMLDASMGGGLRAGSLNLLAGAQGQGKTTFALQVAKHAASVGRASLYFCFEHDADAMLTRLVAMEAGEAGGLRAPGLSQIRAVMEAPGGIDGGLAERFRDAPAVIDGLMHIEKYGANMIFHRSNGSKTSLDTIAERAGEVAEKFGEPPLIVVDYLQKVFVPGHRTEEESTTMVVEGLKDMANELGAPVLAIAAIDHAGLEANQRMRVRHLRGSTALAYEPDSVWMLAAKKDIVSRNHMMYDMANLDKFREWTVLTVEKSRYGTTGESFEFQARFHQGRYEQSCRPVTEKLLDERIVTE